MRDYTDYLIEAYGDILTPSETIYKHSVPIELVPNSPMTPARMYSDSDYQPKKRVIEPDKYIKVDIEDLDKNSLIAKMYKERDDEAWDAVGRAHFQLAVSKPEEDSDFYYLYNSEDPSKFVVVTDGNCIDSYREGHPGKELTFASTPEGVSKALDFVKQELDLTIEI